MKQTPLPTLQHLQERINRDTSEATQRYHTAINRPDALSQPLRPIMHPADTFFAPPSTNPRQTTCLVCAASFPTHAQLCQHVEMRHHAIYNPPQIQMPPNVPPAQFASPGAVFPLNTLQANPTLHPWNRVSAVQNAGAIPSGKPVQPYRCDVCQIGCDTKAILNTHLEGQKHRKKFELRKAFEKATSNLHAEGISEVSPRLWVCKLCKTNIDSENALLQHLEAVKHKRHRQRLPINLIDHRTSTAPVPPLVPNHPVISTPVSAALAVLKDDSIPLPPVSSLFSPPLPGSSMPPPLLPSVSLPTASPPKASMPATSIPTTSMPATSIPTSSIPNITMPAISMPTASVPGTLPPMPPFSAPSVFPLQPTYPERSTALPSLSHQLQPLAPKATISKTPRPPASSSSIRLANPSFSCAICGVTCNSMDSLNCHLAGSRHKRRQLMVETASNLPAAAGQSSAAVAQNIRCEVCDVMICGKPNMEAHLNGKQHAKKLKMKGEQPPAGAAASPGSTSAGAGASPGSASISPTTS